MKRSVRELASYIYLAQKSSDEGKDIFELHALIPSFNGRTAGYSTKDLYIDKAIRTCIKLHNPDFQFGFGWEKKYYSRIVYFNIRLNGKVYQVSFHSPHNDFKQYDGKKTIYCKWSQKVAGEKLKEISKLSSREAAVHVARVCRILN